ncbi:MAG: flavodoxin-dependent (E)-4-hydroxy-3-methylbut-2-enyl-diphosphate synthase [Deltaproteobacteria bacterium]|jgi:(E)-4-hydroxy-3-methylbut-2-enyl-diphosphate synthase|nr:flavodoxin-dependent (E)-4-hydroxy-3-methylbut-2-enyl-diphosphate synthase [Deltaproteobacteria bacterium]
MARKALFSYPGPEYPKTPIRNSRTIRVGTLPLGGAAPIVVQTMTNTDTRDREATLAQIKSCALLGAELIRVAVPDRKAAEALKEIIGQSPVPIIADIHFNSQLAILALEAGAQGVRINPGNIGGEEKLKKVAEAVKAFGATLRVGVNMGSLEKEIVESYGHGPEAMVASAVKDIAILEKLGLKNLKVSLKASSVLDTINAARLFASISDIPQHLGVTEAGGLIEGIAKSSVAFSFLLAQGIGDTIRVSLTASPEAEVDAAYAILRSLGLRHRGIEFISCPTCGRSEIDLIALLADIKERLKDISKPLKVAVMGCVVNGPGEAADADIGVAGGRNKGALFVKGKKVADYPYEKLAQELEQRVRKMVS